MFVSPDVSAEGLALALILKILCPIPYTLIQNVGVILKPPERSYHCFASDTDGQVKMHKWQSQTSDEKDRLYHYGVVIPIFPH